MDIFDYIEKSKNEELKQINTLDAIIFTRLAYIHLEDIIDKLPITIADIEKYLNVIKVSHNDKKLITVLHDSNRFKDIVIKRCRYIENIDKVLIFKAMTISLPNNNIFVSFRGTGKNVYDFKEDMNMSYKEIPSSIEGVKYLEEEKKFNKIYISGHSKGGHVAMYVASHTTFFNKVRIIKVYNFDGPGFIEVSKELKLIQNKIVNYFPESSIVGRMMHSVGEIIPIKTKKQGIEAHTMYNWAVDNNDLIKGKLTENSNQFHEATLNIINIISKEKRETVINYLFTLILKGEIKSLKELDLIKVKEIINNTPRLTKDEKFELLKLFKIFVKCAMPSITKKDNVKEA